MTEKKPKKEKSLIVEGEKEQEENRIQEEIELEQEMPKSASSLSSELGSIRISDTIVAKVAGLAAIEVEGVSGMSGGMKGGISEVFSRKNISRGIKVEVSEKETQINLYMVMDYGVFINDVAKKVQKKVKDAVEDLTGLHVTEVNVFVQGIQLPVLQSEEKK